MSRPPLPAHPFSAARGEFLAGRDSPRDLLERHLERLAAREPEVQAFAALDLDAARAAADASAARYAGGAPRSALDGLPVAVKDIIETEDLPTQMGSPIFAGWRSRRDAACVRALRAAGAVVVGKTHTTEFAIGRSPPTTNPHDPARTPGGSSSGSAAAVAAGMVPLALGTQTAGSVLRPASYCGVVGLKPSHGALSMAGIHPLSRTLDTLGTLAATLEDAWAAAHVIWAAWGGTRPAHALPGPALPPARRPARVAHLRTAGWADLDDESRDAFAAWRERLGSAGIEVVDATGDPALEALERAIADAASVNGAIVRFEMRYPMLLYRERDAGALGERIRGMLEDGDRMTPADHARALAERERMRAAAAALAERYDVFVTLASTGPAPAGLEHTGDRTFLHPWSVIGAPAASLPLLEVGGLPLGVQVMGQPDRDADLAAHARWLLGAGEA